VAELNRAMGTGCAMALAPSRETLLECIAIQRPSAIISVPILFNRVYDGVMKKFEEESPLKRKIIKWAFKVARKRNSLLEFDRSVPALLGLQHTIADKLVFSKIRERLGGRLHYMAAGGAATSLTVLQFFEDIGVPICEGYGLTETSPVISSGTVGWSKRRLGCVGVMLDGVTVKIVDPETLQELPSQEEDGEICVNGPNVMRGYRNNDEANKEVFFWLNGMKYFRTGAFQRRLY
jgi:long-chain acyl-CoA synthetase